MAAVNQRHQACHPRLYQEEGCDASAFFLSMQKVGPGRLALSSGTPLRLLSHGWAIRKTMLNIRNPMPSADTQDAGVMIVVRPTLVERERGEKNTWE